MKVRLTARAERDLMAIGDFIARDDVGRAVALVRALRDKCLSLRDAPRAYPTVPGFAADELRRRVHGNYLIFYRIGAAEIVVLHVLHGARDYMTLFTRS